MIPSDVSRRKKGAMEGLPLQLVIIVIIAAAVLGIIFVWLNQASSSKAMIKRIEVSPEEVSVAQTSSNLPAVDSVDVKIWVYDTKDNEVDGFVITITGAVDHEITKQLNSGDVVSITVKIPPGENSASIYIKAEKGGGMGSAQTTLLAYRAAS